MIRCRRRVAWSFWSGLVVLSCSAREGTPESPGSSVPAAGNANTMGTGGAGGGATLPSAGGVANAGAAGSGGAGTGGVEILEPTSIGVLQAEMMERTGPYSATVNTPFEGVGLYANDDAVSFSFTFPNIPGVYRIQATGASSSPSAARVELLLGDVSQTILGFSGTDIQVAAAELTLPAGTAETQTITLRATGDDGSWDAYIDQVEVFYLGEPAPPPPTPRVPPEPVAQSRAYRSRLHPVRWHADRRHTRPVPV